MTDSILIIEGETTLRRELGSILSRAGFAVADVPDYSEALLKLDEFKPNMVIMDKESVGIEGWTACSELRQAHDVAIILMGKDSSSEGWMRAVEAGADFYIRKPFSYRELVARVKAILRRYGRSTRGNGSENRNKHF